MNKEKSIRMERLGCTTMIVGKNATVDGSVIIAHSDDDVSDARIIFVPGKDEETERNVYYDNCSLGPNPEYNSTEIRRYIGPDRGPGYDTGDYPNSKPLGKISLPYIKKTYSYFDGCYGIMNEHGLMIGECTCGAKVHPEPDCKERIFYASELSRVALERCQTALDAIKLSAELIEKYGYYGTGETLLFGDADEGWVMEMCGYDEKGTNGIWVAQRVPDDHFFVAANEFRIRDIYMSDEDKNHKHTKDPFFKSKDSENTILYSKNLFAVCKEKGWIDQDATQLDWLPTVSYGEYGHPYYSLRRVWRALSKVDPLLHLSPKATDGYTRQYPFSIPVDPHPEDPQKKKKLSILDIASIFRDQYEGTEFDLTKGEAAGPFGNPVRYDLNPDQGDTFNLNTYKPEGAWERPISIYRCAMLWINQAKKINDKTLGISWIGLDRPRANCLMPFYAKMPDLPKSIQTMNLLEFEFDHTPENEPIKTSAWWAFNFVANYINLNYSYMMVELSDLQSKLEAEAFTKINDVLSSGNTAGLIEFCSNHSENVIRAWWQLATQLIVKYNDGCITNGQNNIMEKIDYPKNWLKIAGFYDGPTKY